MRPKERSKLRENRRIRESEKIRERERRDIAYQIASQMRDQKRAELKKQGVTGDALREQTPKASDLADFLCATQKDTLDRMVDERRRQQRLAEAQREKRKSGFLGKDLENAASGFRKHLEKKRKRLESEREVATSKKTLEKGSHSEDPEAVMRDVRKLQKQKHESFEESKEKGSIKSRNLPESKEVKGSIRKPWKIRSEMELERAVELHYDLKARKDYDFRYKDAIKYCNLEKTEGVVIPDLVKELERRELKRLYEIVHGGPPKIKMESIDDVETLIKKHPSERKRTDFEDRKRFSELYFQIKNDHSMKRDEIAKKYEVSKGFVTKAWNDIEPAQIKQLRKLEEDRIVRTWREGNPSISESNLKAFRDGGQIERARTSEIHMINPQIVRDAFESINDTKNLTAQGIASVVGEIIKNDHDMNHRFHCSDFNSILDTQRIQEMEQTLQTNKKEIEESITKTLGHDHDRVRVAVVEGKLYSWTPQHRPDELVRPYEDQFYYFKNRMEVIRIADDLRKSLGVQGNLRSELPHMTRIVKQLIESEDMDASRKKPLDIHSTRIEGTIIRMYLDATQKKLSDLEGSVTKIAGISGRAGIEQPRFPEGEKLQILKARLAATIISDCHLWETGRIAYNEAHLGRITRVQETISEFGNIDLEPKYRKGKYDIHIPCQIGLIMIDEGLTPGNKAINNPGLPSGFMEWLDAAKLAYLEDLIPEDGSFHGGRFTWSRSHAIYVDKRIENYDFESEIGPSEIELVKSKGRKDRGLIPKSSLSIKSLEELRDDKDSTISESAKHLLKVVNESTNNLINDESALAESLDFAISVSPTRVSYYSRSGRVSVCWRATTDSIDDTIRWALKCPPNDERKKQDVETWLRKTAKKWMYKRPLRD